MVLKKLLAPKAPPAPRVPDGQRVYAVGDVHGRRDCLDVVIDAIRADDARRPPAETWLVLLGDLIDRGPDSRGVVERAIELSREWPNFAFLPGNHEEILLSAAKGERSALGLFNRVGGRETLLSYGVPEEVYDSAHLADLAALIKKAVPAEHLAFMGAGEDQIAIGDYLFVHAGINPKAPLDAQRRSDLRWIREPFLSSDRWHGAVVVHGHTITNEPEERPNRIGIDTGAFASGRLTALALEEDRRWYLST